MVTLELARHQVRLEDDDTHEDVLLDGMIRAAYKYAESHTQTRIVPAEVTLVLDRFPSTSDPIELPWTPVRSVVSLEYVDQDGEEQSIEPETLRLDTRSIFPKLYPQFGSNWPAAIEEPESVTITLEVGYPEGDEPADISTAVLLLVGHYYNHREAVVSGAAVDIPMGVGALLAPYVITAVG